MRNRNRTAAVENDQDLIARMADAAGASPSSHIAIASGNVEFLIGLVRHGFSDVSIKSAETMLSDEDEFLLAPGALTPETLRALLARLKGRQEPPGIAVICRDQPALHQIETVLGDYGFSPIVETSCGGGTLLSARKAPSRKFPIAA